MAKLYLLLLFTMLILLATTSGCEYEEANIVVCTRQELSHIPGHFDKGLITLIVSENHIITLDGDVLKQYPKIETLKIDHNFIQTPADLQDVSFLRELRNLDISSNLLDILDFTKFHFNKELENLTANSNYHLKIHESSEELPHLYKIELRNCTLNFLPIEAFQDFPVLQILDLRNNVLTVLPGDMLITLPSLQKLLILENPVINLDPALRNKTDLVNTTVNKSSSIASTVAITSTVLESTKLFSTAEPAKTKTTTERAIPNTSSEENNEASSFTISIILGLIIAIILIAFMTFVLVKYCRSNRIIKYRYDEVPLNEIFERIKIT